MMSEYIRHRSWATKPRSEDEVRHNERLFIGYFPGGVVYADRQVEVNGDYKRLGFLDYGTLTLKIEKGCPKGLEEQIRRDASQYKDGEKLQIAGNLTITLGRGIQPKA